MELWRQELYLQHYGIKGMRWGIRRTPEELGHKTLKKSKTNNLESWGKSPNTNVLYISGLSGGGKSTIAKSLSGENVDVIHLDLYFEGMYNIINEHNQRVLEKRNPRFEEYLKKHYPDYDKMSARYLRENNMNPRDAHVGKMYDKFRDVIDGFGNEEFNHGRKVIVEGIQIVDGGLTADDFKGWKYYKNKPVIIVDTKPFESTIRAYKREYENNQMRFSDKIMEMARFGEMYNYRSNFYKKLSDFSTQQNAKRGQRFVEDYLREKAV